MSFGNVNFDDYYRQMGEHEAGLIHEPTRWIDDISERLQRNGQPWGDRLPWSKTHDLVRFRPGELSIWGGMSGHKKSMLIGWIMCNIAKNHNSPVAIASLEMAPAATLMRMGQQCTGCFPSEEAMGKFLGWADQRFAIYDELRAVNFHRILGFVYYAAKVLNYKHIVIDSLTKCGISPKDTEKEKEFLDKLQWAVKTLGCHIHLVAHIRKPQHSGEEFIPSKFDIRGAGEITDFADNVFICWSDKKRAEILFNQDNYGPDQLSDTERAYLEKSVDQKLIVAKQREGSFEGTINLYFDRRSLQFTAHEGKRYDFSYDTKYSNEDAIPVLGNCA